MKYLLLKASDHDFKEEVEVRDMEDLRALWNGEGGLYGYQFVIDFDKMEITIYDDYLE